MAAGDGAIAEGGGFTVTVAMTSLLGCAGEDFSAVLKSLGYRLENREVQRPAAPKAEEPGQPAEAEVPAEAAPENAEAAGETSETPSAESASPETTAEPTPAEPAPVEAEAPVEAGAEVEAVTGTESAEPAAEAGERLALSRQSCGNSEGGLDWV